MQVNALRVAENRKSCSFGAPHYAGIVITKDGFAYDMQGDVVGNAADWQIPKELRGTWGSFQPRSTEPMPAADS